MKRFTNRFVLKEYKKILRLTGIGLFLILLAAICGVLVNKSIQSANDKMTDLNTVILSNEGSKENQKAYLDAQSIPYRFAVYDDTTDSYYIVSDDRYMYIVYMSLSDYAKLNRKDIYNKNIRIEGITKTTTNDVKELAISAYNKGLEDESEKLSLADFEEYFGSVYLDLTLTDTAVAGIPLGLFILFGLLGEIMFIVGIIQVWRFKRNIKKMDDTKVQELDQEMNDPDAFYYDKAHLYLTKNYIINFNGAFREIRYEDILWMYRFEQRTNGIKTSQSIKVFTNSGKTYQIVTIDVVTKKKKEIFVEIWKTILEHNDKMLVGYTSENIKAMRQKAKEIKKNR